MSYPISQFIEKNGLVFTSGQIYMTPEGKLLEGSVEERAHQVMKNLEKVLTDAGVTFKEVVKSTIYVTSMDIYEDVSKVYGEYVKEPYPARETVCVSKLPAGATIEISMIAVRT